MIQGACDTAPRCIRRGLEAGNDVVDDLGIFHHRFDPAIILNDTIQADERSVVELPPAVVPKMN